MGLEPLAQTRTMPGAMVPGCELKLRKSLLFPTSERRVDVVEEYLSRTKVLPVHAKDVARVHAGRRCMSIDIPDHQVRLRPGHRHSSRYLVRGLRR